MCEVLELGEYYKIKEAKAKWEEIGGYAEVKERLEEMVSLPLRHPEAFEKAHTRPPSGLLIWGPPKAGFGMFAEAAASSAGANYISANASDLLEDAHSIEHLYSDASERAPCVVFINDIDALAPRREAESELLPMASKLAEPETTRLLFAKIDELSDERKVITVGATSRPDVTDPALLRNGRLERKVYLPPPSREDREEILQRLLKDIPLGKDVNAGILADETEHYMGADLVALPRVAVLEAIKDSGDTFERVELRHLRAATKRVPPSVPKKTLKRYNEIYAEECKHRYMY